MSAVLQTDGWLSTVNSVKKNVDQCDTHHSSAITLTGTLTMYVLCKLLAF